MADKLRFISQIRGAVPYRKIPVAAAAWFVAAVSRSTGQIVFTVQTGSVHRSPHPACIQRAEMKFRSSVSAGALFEFGRFGSKWSCPVRIKKCYEADLSAVSQSSGGGRASSLSEI